VHARAADCVGDVGLGQGLSGGALHAEDGEDVTRGDLLDVLHLVGVHFYHAGDFEFLLDFVVPDVGAFF
jgi:hypothetical protein